MDLGSHMTANEKSPHGHRCTHTQTFPDMQALPGPVNNKMVEGLLYYNSYLHVQ